MADTIKTLEALLARASRTTFDGERLNCISQARRIAGKLGVQINETEFLIIYPKSSRIPPKDRPPGWTGYTNYKDYEKDASTAYERMWRNNSTTTNQVWEAHFRSLKSNFRDLFKDHWFYRRWNMGVGCFVEIHTGHVWCGACMGCCGSSAVGDKCSRCNGSGIIPIKFASKGEKDHMLECLIEAARRKLVHFEYTNILADIMKEILGRW